YLWAFVDSEGDVDAARRHLPNLGSDGGVLVTTLCFVFLQHVLGALHFTGIVLRFRAQSDFAIFKTVENLGLTDRFVAGVVDGMNRTAFNNVERQKDAALWTGFFCYANIVKAACIPQRNEVAVNRLFVVNIALFGVDERAKRILRNFSLTPEIDAFNNVGSDLRRFGFLDVRGLLRLSGLAFGRSGNRFKRIRRLLLRRLCGLLLRGLRRGILLRLGGRRLLLGRRLRRRLSSQRIVVQRKRG